MFRKILYFDCPTNSVWARSYDHLKVNGAWFTVPMMTSVGNPKRKCPKFQQKNADFLDLNFSYGFYIITVGRGHVCDLLTKYEVNPPISHRVRVSWSSEIHHFVLQNPNWCYHYWPVEVVFLVKNRDLVDLKWSYGVHTFRIEGGDVWSLLTKYEGHTIILSGLLRSKTVKKSHKSMVFSFTAL